MSDLEETTLATLPEEPEVPLKGPADIVVVASNPQQMQAAQSELVKHFDAKLEALKADLVEAESNLAIAKARKWKTGPWSGQLKKISDNVNFYTKIKAALEAGYVIIPNLEDLDIFAIRTKKFRPKKNVAKGGNSWVQRPDAQQSDKPALGDGRYVNADTINSTWTETTKQSDGTTYQRMMSKAIAFDDVDFPFKLVKPQILEDTSKAMKALIFDDIGILPKRNIRRGDPMVVGRVLNGTKAVSFLITWFVDTSMI